MPPPPATAADAGTRAAVRIRGLGVTYDGHVALRDVDLDLPAGALTTVIGPNGSGKSTLLSVVSGLVAPGSGSVEVLDGTPGRGSGVAQVLQATVVNDAVPLTVREVVAMGRYAPRGAFRRLTAHDREVIDAVIARMRIGDVAGRQLRELSGGQRQRVLVAQGLAQQAGVLLLDEPITGLDLPTQQAISEVVADEVARGVAVVLTTHDVGTAAQADQVVLLATGIVASGPSSQVLTTANLDRAYGGHVHVLDDGTLLIDDPHAHTEAHRSAIRFERHDP